MSRRRIIDIGANLTDEVFRGLYRGKQAHAPDLEHVLERARKVGLEKIIVTAGTLEDAKEAAQLAHTSPMRVDRPQLFSTIGIHPTRCTEFENKAQDEHLESLLNVWRENPTKVIAVGEFGLDYDRLHSKETQLKYFDFQFELARQTRLPLFLHMREACDDLLNILEKNRTSFEKAVIHSFTGTKDEAQRILSMGLYIGINGCSLKTQENLDVLKSIPLDRLLVETDSPYCDIRPSHAGSSFLKTRFPRIAPLTQISCKKEKFDPAATVKGRNEPCHVINVLEVIAGVLGQPLDLVIEQTYANTCAIFFPHIINNE